MRFDETKQLSPPAGRVLKTVQSGKWREGCKKKRKKCQKHACHVF